MKKLACYLIVLVFISASCSKDQWFYSPNFSPVNTSGFNLISPQIKIAVVSDLHYMHPSLFPEDGVDNPYFKNDLYMDRKLLELSDPIVRKVICELIREEPDILLITGDLTKDGELSSHQTMREFLQELEDEGIKVYIAPGNNDINNTSAVKYVKDEDPIPVSSITPEDFAELYANFGFDEAISRDENSLSYICQPYSNLWILGIDAIKYGEDGEVSGEINPATMDWILERMEEARENGITVLPLMHYGIIPHYSVQESLEPLVVNSNANAIALMNAGVRLIFTGHYHANDIAVFSNEEKSLTDIQTGSLVTPPYPYRIMSLDDNYIKIETKWVTSIDYLFDKGKDFLTYSETNLTDRLNNFFYIVLRYRFLVPKEQALIGAPLVTDAFKAYFAGDEKIDPAEMAEIAEYVPEVPAFPVLGIILNSLWTDLSLNDNKIHIKIK